MAGPHEAGLPISEQAFLNAPLCDSFEVPVGTDDAFERNASHENEGDVIIEAWLKDVYDAELANLQAKTDRAKTHSEGHDSAQSRRGKPLTEDTLLLAAAARAEALKRKTLVAIGLRRYGDVPFDQFAQSYLDHGRTIVADIPENQVRKELSKVYKPGGGQYKKVVGTPTETQREALAWERAKERANATLMTAAAEGITAEELIYAEKAARQNEPQQTGSLSPADLLIHVVDPNRQRIRTERFFSSRGESPLSLQEWCELPLRPVVMPEGKPASGAQGLATFLFDRILYAPQVCDRKGRNVGLSTEVRKTYIDKVRYAVERGAPIVASEYVPVVAIGNPIKRNTQGVALAEVDFFRRLAEISKAVELYYEPGMRWLIGNEAPAFQGPEFHLPEGQVKQFHADAETIVRQIDPEGRRLSLFNLAEVLWSTPEQAKQWWAYKRRRSAELHEAHDNPRHPEHEEVVRYIRTFTYPMTTCINPYHFEEAQRLSSGEIAEVYAAIKLALGSSIKGVGAIDGGNVRELSLQQQALLDGLQSWGHGITFKYRTVMDSRASLPAFEDIIPPHTLAHTIVTKRDKMVLYPNSGRGTYFPAHGEPVYVRAQAPEQRSAVTVRPWWQIAAQPDKYRPMYLQDEEEPFYFEEVR